MPTFTNMATLTYSGGTVNSNVVTGELRQSLTMTKTALRSTYAAGEELTYVISILNSGTAPLTELTLTDNLGAYAFGQTTVTPLTYQDGTLLYYVNGVLQAAPTLAEQAPLTITGLTVPAGGNALVVYETRANTYAPLEPNSSITNTASVTGGGLTEAVQAQETITIRPESRLVITKALEPAVVTDNGQLTYTFTIQNLGNTAVTSADNAAMTDPFDPILTNPVVTFNTQTWAEGTDYTYDAATGLFATTAGRITVPAASTTQNADGTWTVTPGVSILIVTGTV